MKTLSFASAKFWLSEQVLRKVFSYADTIVICKKLLVYDKFLKKSN